MLAERASRSATPASPKTPAASFRLGFDIDRIRTVLGRDSSHCFNGLCLGFILARHWCDYAYDFVRACRRVFQKLHVAFRHRGAWLFLQRNPNLRRATDKQEAKHGEGENTAEHARGYTQLVAFAASLESPYPSDSNTMRFHMTYIV